jgi:hypothetical protein
MPSKDPIKLESNEWMANDPDPAVRASYFALERRLETKPRARGDAASPTAPSAILVRLARRLGRDPDELAAELSDDTLRRTANPVIEERTEDGKTIFKHPTGIVEGRLHARR